MSNLFSNFLDLYQLKPKDKHPNPIVDGNIIFLNPGEELLISIAYINKGSENPATKE